MKMSKENFLRKMNLQMEVNADLKESLEFVRKALKPFDGKMINVKIKDALPSYDSGAKTFMYYNKEEKQIVISHQKPRFTPKNSYNTIEANKTSVNVYLRENWDEKKLDYKYVNKEIDDLIKDLNKKDKKCSDNIEKAEKAIEDMENIKKLLRDFREEYNWDLKEDLFESHELYI